MNWDILRYQNFEMVYEFRVLKLAINHSSEKKKKINNKIIIIIIVNFWAGLHNKNSPSFLKNKLASSYALCECNEAF